MGHHSKADWLSGEKGKECCQGMQIFYVPIPMAMFGVLIAFMFGATCGTMWGKKQGMMGGGRHHRMGWQRGHHHHGRGTPACCCEPHSEMQGMQEEGAEE